MVVNFGNKRDRFSFLFHIFLAFLPIKREQNSKDISIYIHQQISIALIPQATGGGDCPPVRDETKDAKEMWVTLRNSISVLRAIAASRAIRLLRFVKRLSRLSLKNLIVIRKPHGRSSIRAFRPWEGVKSSQFSKSRGRRRVTVIRSFSRPAARFSGPVAFAGPKNRLPR